MRISDWSSDVCSSDLHGEAVAAGMALAFAFSAEQGLCAAEDAARVAAHLRDVGLPDGLATANVDTDGETLVAPMLHDNKMDAGTLPFLLARGIGKTYPRRPVDVRTVGRQGGVGGNSGVIGGGHG